MKKELDQRIVDALMYLAGAIEDGDISGVRRFTKDILYADMKCCNGLGAFGKCGRGTKKGCDGNHCKCMAPTCPYMHYVDCFKHYIHVEHIDPNE